MKNSIKSTKDSFDYQWEKIAVDYSKEELLEFQDEILSFTDLSKDWFKGKRVIDVGCGGGRYTWGFCNLGSDVTAIDQSINSLKLTEKVCKDFQIRIAQHDVLQSFDPSFPFFDLVWCFGVVHHTGDTFKALKRVISFVKENGYLFLMIYGKPTNISGEEEIAEYVELREEIKDMSFEERVKYIGEFISADPKVLHGYFDAISPEINDLYSFKEIKDWFEAEGFECNLTPIINRNHRIIARRKSYD